MRVAPAGGETQHRVVIIVRCDGNLLEVILALAAASGFAGGLNGGKQQGDEDADDGDDD
jgi:hypothetical protein